MMNDDNLNFKQYFNEHVPLELKQGEELKHRYTVTITKAVYDEESFQVYRKYQEKIHNEKEKQSEGYKRFLC